MSEAGASESVRARGVLPFLAVLVLIALYFGLVDPYEPAGPNLVPGSDFESDAWAGTMPGGWRGLGELARWSPTLGYDASGGVELETGTRRGGRLEWILDDPSRFEHVRVRGRLRVENVEPGARPWNVARLVFFCREEGGRSRWDVPHNVAYLVGTRGWRLYEETLSVPEEAHTGHLVAQQAGTRGRLFVDDLELIPVQLKPSAAPVRRTLFVLWILSFGLALAALRPWRRPAGLVTAGLAVVIVVGVSAPADSFHRVARWQAGVLEEVGELWESARAPEAAPPRSSPPEAGKPARKETAKSSLEGGEGAQAKPGTDAEPKAKSEVEAPLPPPRPAKPSAETEPADTGESVRDLKKLGHALLFGLLSFFATVAYAWGGILSRRLLVAGALTVFAGSTELLQFMVARRQPTWLDWSMDLLGIVLGMLVAFVLALAPPTRGVARKERGEGPKTSP